MHQQQTRSRKRDYAAIAASYVQDVLSGKTLACAWVKAACQRQADDLAKENFHWHYDPRYGARVCNFIELLKHVKGPKANTLIRLEPWQVFILMTIFSWVSPEGKRRFRRAYLECPKGQGKSLWSSGVALYMLALDGEAGAEIYSAATTRDQAKIVFTAAQEMARKAMPEIYTRYEVEISKDRIYVLESGSFFKPLSSEANSLEGLNPHFVVIDELHAHRTREVYDSLVTAAVKRDQPLIWCITTAGSNREGICYEEHSRAIKMFKGASDDRFFAIIYTADEADDWSVEETWRKANPNWGISVYPDAIGVSGKTIRVMRILVNNANSSTSTTITIQDSTPTTFTGAMLLQSGGALAADSDGGEPLWVTGSGQGFVINSGSAVQVSGCCWYTQS